ncbi:MAG: BMP family protein [Candidatus Thorarchaeota archaeon]
MKRNSLIAIILIVIIIVVSVGIAAYFIFFPPIPPVLPDNPNEVAIVFATGGLGDKSFNDGCYAGAVNAHNDFNVNFTFVEPTAIAEYEPFLRAYAEHAGLANPYELIISIGFDQADAVMAVAEDFPDQEFAIVDMYIDPVTYPNVRSIIFSANEGSALVGALAGLYTATGNIAFVGGMDIPLIREFAAGYFWGANITVPGIAMNATKTAFVDNAWVGDWANPGLAETIADGLYTTGFDIIFAAAGRSGLGVIDSAYKQNATIGPVWAIGVDSPQMYLGTDDPDNPTAPTVVLTSMLKRVDVAINQTIVQKVISGLSIGGFTLWNLANGGVGWELNNTLLGTNWAVSPADQATIADVAQGIVNGTYTVPIDFAWL